MVFHASDETEYDDRTNEEFLTRRVVLGRPLSSQATYPSPISQGRKVRLGAYKTGLEGSRWQTFTSFLEGHWCVSLVQSIVDAYAKSESYVLGRITAELQVSSCCEGFNLPQPEWFDAWLKIICELNNLDSNAGMVRIY